MDEKQINRLLKRKMLEDSLRQEFEGSLSDRVERYLEVKPHEIIPNGHFAKPSSESSKLFRDGHFYGCISLTQSVAEALTRFLCERNSMKPVADFEKNVLTLQRRQLISAKLQEQLLKIWEKRNDYHHLNPNIEQDRQQLQSMAGEKLKLLQAVESQIFEYRIADGKLVPSHPKYWDVNGDQVQVYLRLE